MGAAAASGRLGILEHAQATSSTATSKPRTNRLADLTAALSARRLPVRQWYGVRVFTDTAPSDAPLPEPATLDAILRHEERAGRTDPYRHVAALLHLVAVRPDNGAAS